jgi:hypothetical protein
MRTRQARAPGGQGKRSQKGPFEEDDSQASSCASAARSTKLCRGVAMAVAVASVLLILAYSPRRAQMQARSATVAFSGIWTQIWGQNSVRDAPRRRQAVLQMIGRPNQGAGSTDTSRARHGSLQTPWPEVFIIGAPKSATTSLFDALLRHADLCAPTNGAIGNKEVHFFNLRSNFEKGSRFYLSHFGFDGKCSPAVRRVSNRTALARYIDATPTYLRSPGAAQRMHDTIPGELHARLRFLAVLREPVSRHLSWFNHEARFRALHKRAVRGGREEVQVKANSSRVEDGHPETRKSQMWAEGERRREGGGGREGNTDGQVDAADGRIPEVKNGRF